MRMQTYISWNNSIRIIDFNKVFKSFLINEGFNISNELSNDSNFKAGGLKINLNIEDRVEKELTFKALEKRATFLKKIDNSFIISNQFPSCLSINFSPIRSSIFLIYANAVLLL